MDQVSKLLADLVPKKGKNKSVVAKRLGISPQLLGQYIQGRQKPKVEFFNKWKETFGEDLLNKATNVSHETSTPPVGSSGIVPDSDVRDHLATLKNHNSFLQSLVQDKLLMMESNLTAVLAGVAKQTIHFEAVSTTSLESLARLEKKKPDALKKEADKKVVDKLNEISEHHTEEIGGRQNNS